MKKTILIADDEEDIVDLLKVVLEGVGYRAVTAYDGLHALEQINAEVPDLILLDVMMPGMSGLQVLIKLKSNPVTRDIPVIMLTARSNPTDVSDAWSLGADMYLLKPFDPDELINFVTRLCPLGEA